MTTAEGTVRVDRWLWAARLFKTRSQAAKACVAGHIKVDGESIKAAKTVGVGNEIEAHTPGGLRIVVILLLHDKRGPASLARTLYEDHTPPPPPREPPNARRERGAGRPTKRERREIERFRGE